MLDARRVYWKRTLTELPVLQLPTTRVYPRIASFSEATEAIELPLDLSNALKTLSGHKGSGDFITLLTAFKVLLARYTSQDDIVVASPIPSRCAGQTDSGAELLSKTLLLRTQLDGDPTFGEAMQKVRETTRAAYQHAPIPFDALVEALGPHWKDSPSLFFQVMFDLLGDSRENDKVNDLIVRSSRGEYGKVKCDLVMSWTDSAEGLRGALSYNANRFDSDSIRWMARCFRTLLHGVVNDPDARLSVLPLLDSADRHKILVEWNETQRGYSSTVCLHELVEAQVERTPHAIAAVFEDESLTYFELNRRANWLAWRLRKQGVVPDNLVGIIANHSFEMVIGCLATLKAGGAFLPLDPDDPPERLAFVLGEAKPCAVLAERHFAGQIPEHAGQVLLFDQDADAVRNENLTNQARAKNLAYVIYTSGSTGQPKGVMNTHRGICNRLFWIRDNFCFKADDCMLQNAHFAFDVSVGEMFLPLTVGARFVMTKPAFYGDGRYLADVICKHSVTTLEVVPSLLATILEEEEIKKCVSIRRVLSGGEALSIDLQDRFFERLPHANLHNTYGPTEAAIDVTFWKCERDAKERSVPIGHPGANTQIYVLDRCLAPVPPGMPGELHIGGVQLARGYLARPDLTAERFVPNPFGKGRLYKSGDLARFRADGAIEFLGRLDFQAKLRGLRIEPGEIEAVLNRHPAVRNSVVIVRNGAAESHKRLVAYIAAEGVSTSDLRQHLQKSLPRYMIPSAFVFLEELPLTRNGKLDREALPAPLFKREERDFVAPHDSLEAELVSLWEKTLGASPIGVTDDFFALGGDSFLAVRVFVEIEKMLGRKMPVSMLVQTPTIDKLAEALRRQRWEPTWSPLVVIQAGGSRPPFFGVHHGYGTVMFYRQLAQRLGQGQPFYGLQAHGLDGRAINYRSVEEIAQSYIRAMRTVQVNGPYFLGGYSLGGVIAFEIAQQLRRADEEVALLVLFDATNPARPPRRYTLAERLKLRLRATHGLSCVEKLKYFSDRACAYMVAKMSQWQGDIHRIIARINRSNLTIVPAELRGLYVLSGYMQAADAYQPRTYAGKLILFRARDPDDGYEHARDRGWGEFAQGGLEIHDVPGHHGSIFEEPHVETLAQKLQTYLKLN
ncbi:MAG: amino acid adenylation domain-containing protein [Verrucomicrobia bacterium]|nr:amino acid adenylation domain-containing protein [Verrucomicrobiota bacterium]